MAARKNNPAEDTSDREIVITRVCAPDATERENVSTRFFRAPRALVFRAFCDPRHLAQWWGPKGFANTFHEFDLKPGGYWRFVMHGPDGTDYPNENEFIEIVPSERIVFRHLQTMHRFQMTMTFAEQTGGTRLTWRMLFDSVPEFVQVKAFIPEANEQNFDRLESHLVKMT